MPRILRPLRQSLLGIIFVFYPLSLIQGAQSVLLRADTAEPPAIASARTYAGIVAAVSRPVEPAPELTVLILADTLSDREMPKLRDQLTALWQAVGSSHPLTLVLVKDQVVRRQGPFKSLARFQAALNDLGKLLAASPIRCKAQIFDALLSTSLDEPRSNWPSVLVVGRFEEVVPDLQPVVEACLFERFRVHQLRLTYWEPSGERWLPLEGVARSTGGMVAPLQLTHYADFLDRKPQSFTELKWADPPLKRGFHFYRAALLDRSGNTVDVVSALAVAAGGNEPDLALCFELRERVKALTELAKEAELTPDRRDRLRVGLDQVLTINPYDAEALHLAVSFYRRVNETARLAALLDDLTQLEPDDAQHLAELGHTRFVIGDPAQGEVALMRARELQPGNSQVSEDLARISAARQDLRAAIAFAEESLAANSRNQDLWFWCAGLYGQIKDWTHSADALEHGLDLGGAPLTERTNLIRLYLQHNNPEKALSHIRKAVAVLPEDAAVCGTYADFLEQLGQKQEALQLWERALAANPGLESAHYSRTRLFLDMDDPAGAVRAADAGLAAAPESARIHLAKSYAQEKLGWWYEARRTLQRAAASIQDLQLLRRYAQVEDSYGRDAPRCYQMLAQALEKIPPESDYLPTLVRGFQVALRDADLERAQWFAVRIEKVGHKEYASMLGSVAAHNGQGALIPGGIQALMFAARGKEQGAQEQFFARFSRTVLDYLAVVRVKEAQDYVDGIIEHFRRITELERHGTRVGSRVTVVLSTQDEKSRKATEEVLRLIGWRLQASKNAVKVEIAEKGPAADLRLTAASLHIDELAMQEDLQAGHAFSIGIVDDKVAILFGEDLWRNQFYANRNLAGGFAEALVRNPNLAKIYVGLSALDAESATALLQDVGLKQLSERYADLLHSYSSAMAVIGRHVTLPGGDKAAPVWEQLVGARLNSPGVFFRTLLKKDDGKMLAFYFNLAQLDAQHQEFFTQNAARAMQYYELFQESPDLQSGAARSQRTAPFIEFIRGVPLDADLHVRFPGSPQVWMVAKGQSDSLAGTAALLRKAEKLVAPEEEDRILTRLMRTSYTTNRVKQSELDNFLAVASIENHRRVPLDEQSALMLAQEFGHYKPAWPYFAILTGLSAAEFQKFFALGTQVRDYETVRLNDLMGQLHSLIELLCLLRQAGRIDEQQSTKLFSTVCDRFARARDPGDLTAASLEITREVLRQALKEAPSDPDEAMEGLLLDSPIAGTLEAADKSRRLAATKSRRENYRRVLELQKVTSLRTLFSIYDAAGSLAASTAGWEMQIKLLEESSRGLLTVEIPESIKFEGKLKNSLLSFQPAEVTNLIAKLQQTLAKRPATPQDVQKLTAELLRVINPQVKIALAGIVYAYYLSPDDLPVSAYSYFASISSCICSKLKQLPYLCMRRRSSPTARPEVVFSEASLISAPSPAESPLRVSSGRTKGSSPSSFPRSAPFGPPVGATCRTRICASSV